MNCKCGCGQETKLSNRTRSKHGQFKGLPLKFIYGHNRRGCVGGVTNYKDAYVIEKQSGCWIWKGSRWGRNKSYGRVGFNYKRICAHRFYYKKLKGDIPQGMKLDHLCRNTLCVNPEHLEPVTNAINVQRGNSAKLSMLKATAIRNSQLTTRELSKQYGVSIQCIRFVLNNKTWRTDYL